MNVRYQYVDKDGRRIIDEIHKIVVHKFSMGDVEDPDLYAAGPIYEWEQSDSGKFVTKHAVSTPEWHRHADPYTFGYTYLIVVELEKKKLSEFYLRFDKSLKI